MAENKTPANVKAESPKKEETPKAAAPETVKPNSVPAALKGEDAKKDEPKPLTEADLKAMYDNLPGDVFREAVDKINAEIEAHNRKVGTLKAQQTTDPNAIKAEIFEQNPNNNEKLAVLRKRELALQDQIEKIRKEAYAVIDAENLMPKSLTPEDVEKLKGEVAESAKSLRDQRTALEQMENMMPVLKGNFLPLVKAVETLRGTGTAAKSGGNKSSEGVIKRPRFKKIEINGVTKNEKGETVYGVVNGEEKYTFSLAAQYLRKMRKGINWTANDLQTEYYKHATDDTEIHEFTMPYTYKDQNGNEVTLNYVIKTYK